MRVDVLYYSLFRNNIGLLLPAVFHFAVRIFSCTSGISFRRKPTYCRFRFFPNAGETNVCWGMKFSPPFRSFFFPPSSSFSTREKREIFHLYTASSGDDYSIISLALFSRIVPLDGYPEIRRLVPPRRCRCCLLSVKLFQTVTRTILKRMMDLRKISPCCLFRLNFRKSNYPTRMLWIFFNVMTLMTFIIPDSNWMLYYFKKGHIWRILVLKYEPKINCGRKWIEKELQIWRTHSIKPSMIILSMIKDFNRNNWQKLTYPNMEKKYPNTNVQ